MTEPTKYRRDDLIRSIEEIHSNSYPRKTASLKAFLISVLVQVEARDPEMFQEIMEFEMRCQERVKALYSMTE